MSQWPIHANPRPDSNREAKAPYNFVPLPDHVLEVQPGELLSQDRYYSDADHHTGWLECTLTTASPLYVRAALDEEEFKRLQAEQEQTDKEGEDRETASTQEEGQAKSSWKDWVRNKPDFFYTERPQPDEIPGPVIPGSSLRGMLRSLVEIVGYGKVQWVTAEPRYFFRAVAAPRSDPLARPYKEALGKVQAGYVVKRREAWYVLPAKIINGQSYFKVRETDADHILEEDERFNSDKYKPGYRPVSFTTRRARGEFIVDLIDEPGRFRDNGVMVRSGNMLESSGKEDKRRAAGQKASDRNKSPRRKHTVVPDPPVPIDRAALRSLIPIDEQAVQDYVAGLTDFEREPPFDRRTGILVHECPVFYLVDDDGKIRRFGHTPNFRVPYQRPGDRRASTPLDFVPLTLREPDQVDLAEAMFGYAPQRGEDQSRARAGRVFVTDARLTEKQEDVWLNGGELLTPKILASPKPTTFQHYLVQPTPNDSASLRHYASATPGETVIRGHKLYWHRSLGLDKIKENEEKQPIGPGDTQHTQMRPIRAGVQFKFRVYFENLSNQELGVLLWILARAGEEPYRLKLGMGKPYGLGAVQIKHTLHLTDCQQRYRRLFQDRTWASGETDVGNVAQRAIEAFEECIRANDTLNPTGATSLAEVWRIRTLLAMLSWPGPEPAKDKTRYLEIEHLENGNEYKNRPVLPEPLSVSSGPSALVHQAPKNEVRPLGPDGVPLGFEKGTIKMYQRGARDWYGFIIPESGGANVYFQRANLARGVSEVKPRQMVIFRRVLGMRGPDADEIEPWPPQTSRDV